MAAKRSPILGYNHNVRYRGIVFHVQTEDSGLSNPHVFSHLFHGGVIISTRKLVYDPDATEEVVKSLMQAQHKAVMKELKNMVFDEKIDVYLAGTVGLLPRGQGKTAEGTQPSPLLDEALTPFDPAAAVPTAIAFENSEPVIEVIDASPTVPVPVVRDVLPLEETGPTLSRAPTERASPVASGYNRNDISEAMQAIQVGDDELAAAGLVEIDDVTDASDVAEVHSPAPAAIPEPPGVHPERPGQYSVNAKRGSGPLDQIAGTRPPIPRPTPAGNKLPVSPPLPPPRAPARTTTPPSLASPPPSPATPRAPAKPPTQPPRGPIARPTPPAVPRMGPRPLVDPIPRPGTHPPRGRPATGGGVVVSRPPVIVGGPSKTVGTPAGQGKVRRAKETDGGIGGDLISERSLDEVILAYLSEDTSDE